VKIGIFLPNATFDFPGTPEVGGIEVYAMDLGEALLALGHDVTLFGGEPKEGKVHRKVMMRLRLAPYWETKDIPKLGTRFRKLVQRLHFAYQSRHSIKQEHCDIMFVFKPYDFISARFWKMGNPHLCVVMNYQGKDFFPTDNFWKKSIDWEYACSDDNAALVVNRYGNRPDVLTNGVDTNFFSLRKDKVFDKHVVSVGRLVGWKGLHSMAEALLQLPGWKWTIAGEGPEKEKLFDFAKKNNIQHRISFRGALDTIQLREHFASADIMVQPSIDFDACPTSVLQALSSGVPIILSDKVGLAKDILAHHSGFVFESSNVKEMVHRFMSFEQISLDEKNKIALSARLLAEKNYSLGNMARTISDRLEILLKKKGPL